MERFRLTRLGGRKAEASDAHGGQAHGEGAARVKHYLSANAGALDDSEHSGATSADSVKTDVSVPEQTHANAEQSRSAPDEGNFDRFGEQVSSVLHAAREAAARIQDEAQDEAERIRGQAQRDAEALTKAARQDADAAREEAQQMRAEAEEWANQTRAASEAAAAEQHSEARAEATRILSEAQQQANSAREEAERRHQALTMDISLAEDHLRKLATGLHEVATRLDGLLASPSEPEDGEESSLVETLAPHLQPRVGRM